MRQWIRTVWDRLRSSYWFVPSTMAAASVALALIMVALDEHFRDDALRQQGWIYSGGPEGARAVLSTIAGSIITVAGTTFSITIAALSLASAQFGPRLLRNFMRDTGNQVVLGTFTSTFLYCILVLRTVRGLEDNTYVPHLSVTVGVLLAVLSLGVLIYFIHHIAESIQVGHIINVVAEELHSAVARLFPSGGGQTGGREEPAIETSAQITADREGYLQAVDERALVSACESGRCMARLLHRPGDYVVRGMPLAVSSRALEEEEQAAIRAAFTFGRARTPQQDAVFVFLQLSEIALRALSPGVNDPFTAIMCIDRITSAIAQLAHRSLPHPVHCDSSGHPRMIAHPYTYDDLVEAAYRHIREAASGHWQVCRHLQRQIEYVAAQARDARLRVALTKELTALGTMRTDQG
jgi:uncharacterized membrane protein